MTNHYTVWMWPADCFSYLLSEFVGLTPSQRAGIAAAAVIVIGDFDVVVHAHWSACAEKAGKPKGHEYD
jgi:hypothetical protein